MELSVNAVDILVALSNYSEFKAATTWIAILTLIFSLAKSRVTLVENGIVGSLMGLLIELDQELHYGRPPFEDVRGRQIKAVRSILELATHGGILVVYLQQVF